MATIFVCPGRKDDTETCAYWSMSPGSCPTHDLKLKPKTVDRDFALEIQEEDNGI